MFSRIITSHSLPKAAARAAPLRGLHSTVAAASPVHVGAVQVPGDSRVRTVTVLPGKGIGPELVNAAMQAIKTTTAPVEFEIVDNIDKKLSPEAVASLRKNGVGIKGEFITDIGRKSLPSVNIDLRKTLGLFANVVHAFNPPGIQSRHQGVDIVIIRENTEGEYSGMEHEVAPGITESLKVMTREGTRRIAQYAFEYALLNNRAKVTAVHKANIMKQADGIFLESCREVAKSFPTIEYEEVIVDNCMMQLVANPQQYDVMVTPNFYGSLVTSAVAGLVGGAGIAPGANIGYDCAMFEQGARHAALPIAGKGICNPTGILLSSVMMLRHLKLPNFADRLESAIFSTLQSDVKTVDVGGSASTQQFMDAICERIEQEASSLKTKKKGKGMSKSV